MNTRTLGLLAGILAIGLPVYPQNATFGGPSILSRGLKPVGPGDGEPIRFRGYASIQTGYSGQLQPLATDDKGAPVQTNSQYTSVGFGLYGSKSGRRDYIGGMYSGAYALFNERFQSGVNQRAMLSYGRQVARRWVAQVGLAGSTQTTVLGPTVAAPLTSTFETPLDTSLEAFDGRVIGLAGQAGASYQATARLTFSMGGSTMTQRRHSRSLASANSYGAGGEINYSLSRRTGVGAAYSYNKMMYSGGFGDADGMTWTGLYRRQLNRIWSFGGGLGVFRMESIRLQSFQVDPQIAAITGVVREVGRFYGSSTTWAGNGALTGSFRNASLNFLFGRGQSPGNGLALAGLQERFTATAAHTERKMSAFGGFTWVRQKPLLPGLAGLATYRAYGPVAGLNYHLFSFVHASVQAQLRKQVIQTPLDFNPSRYTISAGLSFSPGELPLRIF